MLSFSLKSCNFMRFKQKWILMKAFVELVWNYVSLWVWNKSQFLWINLWFLTLNSLKFMSFKQNRLLMKTFLQSQFEVISVYEFQPKSNSYEGICWVWVWSYVRLRVSNKIEPLWRHLLSFSLKLCKIMTFKPSQILMKTFFEPHFEVM